MYRLKDVLQIILNIHISEFYKSSHRQRIQCLTLRYIKKRKISGLVIKSGTTFPCKKQTKCFHFFPSNNSFVIDHNLRYRGTGRTKRWGGNSRTIFIAFYWRYEGHFIVKIHNNHDDDYNNTPCEFYWRRPEYGIHGWQPFTALSLWTFYFCLVAKKKKTENTVFSCEQENRWLVFFGNAVSL